MKISFKIDYQTVWGETLLITGSSPSFGAWDPQKAVEMQNLYPGEWMYEFTETPDEDLHYNYLLRDVNGNLVKEWGKPRKVDKRASFYSEIRLRDFWRSPKDAESVMFSSAFTKVLMRRRNHEKGVENEPFKRNLRIQVHEPRVDPKYVVALLGNQPALGEWDENRLLIMDESEFPLWKIDIDASQLTFPIQFKYLIYDKARKKVVTWEEGSNRMIRDFVCKAEKSMKVHTDERFRFPLGHWRGAGVAIPLFSLRTSESGGIGEFPDLIKLVDWAKNSGIRMIQLLPLNETVATHSWVDSYPYKSISTIALHPVYLNINKMGVLNEESLMVGFIHALSGFNARESVHYDEVHKVKSKFFKLIFDQQMESFLQEPGYLKFFGENKDWLIPYAAYCYLRDRNKTPNFRNWSEYSLYNKAEIENLCSPSQPHFPDIAVHYFIQYHAHKQLSEAVEYARANGVVLKGDIPIGISPNSIEAWTQPEFFNLGQQAGAPPDAFAYSGQNWGFPTYNWETMAKDGYNWWKKRLLHLSKYFDAYRIDHILGFFRIWEIPVDQVLGTMGHFNPALPYTRDEIIDRGILFNEERFTKPYIREYFLHELFGELTDEVKIDFLKEYEPGKYNLKSTFDTQRKIWDYFEKHKKGDDLDGRETRLREGLCALVAEVLFVRDPYHPSRFHPRIAFHDTNSYLNLSDQTRFALDELYIEYFYNRHEQFWRAEAMKKLPEIVRSTDMLVCGEDLGMVPDCVPGVMRELGILSLEIQRMPKDPNIEFGHPADAPYLSVCSTSTHDTSTLRGWWEEDRGASDRFFRTLLGQKGDFPHYLETWVAREILNQHLWSPAMWAIFPIQDLLAIDETLRREEVDNERINIPAIAQHYWRYRMHLTIEDLLKANRFNSELLNMITHTGRHHED